MGEHAMTFVQPREDNARYSAGIAVAVVFHIVLVWALMNGLARKVVQAISAPIEAKLIEEVKPPPPPPKVIEMPPPPKFVPPPPAFVPPPEVQVQAPPPPQPTITVAVAEPPPAPPVITRAEVPAPAPIVPPAPPAPIVVLPPPPPAPAPAPAPPPAPAPVLKVSASVACANYRKVMGDAGFPREATRLGIDEGSALIQFTLGARGEIKDIKALSSSHLAFEKASIRTVSAYQCAGQGREITVQVPFLYKSD
jgi:periplasmic protein TonB